MEKDLEPCDDLTETANILTLRDENGEEFSLEFVDTVTYDGDRYAALLPLLDDEDEDDGALIIMKLEASEENAEETEFVSVTDERTLNDVFDLFREQLKDEFAFGDEDDALLLDDPVNEE